ncbi:MAG TPA: hypothetical protein VGQ42_17880 [Candidatus Dormibacteraeota bacterium]|nr:hypothetical protein [Candidatus Dormibacteraeota bacterium]
MSILTKVLGDPTKREVRRHERRVEGDFAVRGGIHTVVVAEHHSR